MTTHILLKLQDPIKLHRKRKEMTRSQQKELSDFTSPAGTPTQIWSTAALFLPTYVCAEKETIIPLYEAF